MPPTQSTAEKIRKFNLTGNPAMHFDEIIAKNSEATKKRLYNPNLKCDATRQWLEAALEQLDKKG